MLPATETAAAKKVHRLSCYFGIFPALLNKKKKKVARGWQCVHVILLTLKQGMHRILFSNKKKGNGDSIFTKTEEDTTTVAVAPVIAVRFVVSLRGSRLIK